MNIIRPRKLKRLPRPRGYAIAGMRSEKALDAARFAWTDAYERAVRGGPPVTWTVARRIPAPFTPRPPVRRIDVENMAVATVAATTAGAIGEPPEGADVEVKQ